MQNTIKTIDIWLPKCIFYVPVQKWIQLLLQPRKCVTLGEIKYISVAIKIFLPSYYINKIAGFYHLYIFTNIQMCDVTI